MSSSERNPGFFGRLGLAFVKLVRFVLVVALVAGIGVGGYFAYLGYNELLRVNQNQTDRINANSERIFEARNDITRMEGDEIPDFGADISDVESNVGFITDRVAALEEALAAAEAQSAALAEALETAVSTNTSEMSSANEAILAASTLGETALDDVAALQSQLLVLQSDINDNGERVDSIGGEVDQINNMLTMLDTNLGLAVADVNAVADSAAEANTLRDGTLRQTLALFRVSQLVTRARVHLVEDNAGLAVIDVQAAIDAIELLEQNSSDPVLLEQLETIQARLALALINLPDRVLTATGDLESAWEALDSTLVNIINPLVEAVEEAEAAAGEAEATDEAEETDAAVEEEETAGDDEAAEEDEAETTDEAVEPTGTPEATDESGDDESGEDEAEGTPTPEPTDEAEEEEATPTPSPTPSG